MTVVTNHLCYDTVTLNPKTNQRTVSFICLARGLLRQSSKNVVSMNERNNGRACDSVVRTSCQGQETKTS